MNVSKYNSSVVGSIFFIFTACIQFAYSSLPCSYFDSVDLTGIEQLPNGTYSYDGELYTSDMIGIIDYRYTNATNKVPAADHIRGCLCNRKPCIRMCCKENEIFNNKNKTCINDDRTYNQELHVFKSNGDNFLINIFSNTFGRVYGHLCNKGYFLDPDMYHYDEWKLYTNGSIVRLDDFEAFPNQEYCFAQSHSINSNIIRAFICYKTPEEYSIDLMFKITAIGMMISVPFMILTILVYAIIPELRNIHGKSLICYLSGLVIGYPGLAYVNYATIRHLTPFTCSLVGYCCYYFLVASFFWLSVISFDLYWNFQGDTGINKFNDNKKFLMYSVYAWGSAGIMLAITGIAQNATGIPEIYKPGLGDIKYCWLNTHLWIQLAYFFGPVAIIICFNIVMFILTTLKIHKVQKEMSRIMARDDNCRHLEKERDKFGLFLRLFVMMGGTWSIDIISWLAGDSDWMFRITDIFNALQGFIIFALFVCNGKVIKLIKKRYRIARGLSMDRSRTLSSNTTATSKSMKSVNCPEGLGRRLSDEKATAQ